MSEAGAAELLNAMVPLFRIRPVIDDSCRFGGSWESLHAPNGRGWAQFHMVTRGACVVERPGLGPQRLEAGDILLLPHGDSHLMRSEVRGAAGRVSTETRNGIRQRTMVDAAVDTELLCGRFLFETSLENPLIAALPDEIILRTAGEPLLERFRRLLLDIREELDAAKAGSEMVAADLARALFVMMLRDHLTEQASSHGTLSLLQDRTTARVVLAILGDLARDWTLDEMAAVAIASRATLVRAFQKRAGVAPMTFLSDLRLAIARKRLAGTSDPIAKIADEIGYASESALSKAIMRKYGMRPGALRMEPGAQPVAVSSDTSSPHSTS
ncbi:MULTISPECIES: AraC family transcriptional regulator [unclassified Bradyrhizobium]|uniref:AraC family transcriptional regulator n=1 Tax=unclassified Bradyrhizobium TaxID=2631580 RepID=UPI0020B3ACA5|nr:MULTISPECIES: AraC family transcriptional regulator [unclassified Bradyrhizobium]MCP3385516.1 AraC family transcriptional regulator [Bradyrhizobium sp. CCGUVB4N]MCP3446782.1 AraC family transcriptional regulator [Bradyrhizobium sp. CCGUVB14]